VVKKVRNLRKVSFLRYLDPNNGFHKEASGEDLGYRNWIRNRISGSWICFCKWNVNRILSN